MEAEQAADESELSMEADIRVNVTDRVSRADSKGS